MSNALHFAVPFRYVPTRLGGVEPAQEREGTPMEIADCVELTLWTVQGQRTTLPTFGRPDDLEFGLDPGAAAIQIQAAIELAEPRARAIVEGDHDPRDPGVQRILTMWTMAEEA